MITHTYLIASSVGGSILSIFREQPGERLQCSLWNMVVDPNQLTRLHFPGIGRAAFYGGMPSVITENHPNRVDWTEDENGDIANAVRVTTELPIETVIVNHKDEYLIEQPELIEAA